ncbi:hypothetical protein F5Y15DRAFT_347818 [Xylariaceae sp. FL0016]|nr:hypothetical protein F5Y15DRAFT_347818 [Xylariaceae sp. FL0016]
MRMNSPVALGAFTRRLCRPLQLLKTSPSSKLISPTSPYRQLSTESVSHHSNRVQVYISRSTDPHLNLSIEHFLLQKSHPDSVVLFLYTNRPCVVIGRNQNPWVEVNLGLINKPDALQGLRRRLRLSDASNEPQQDPVALVRRRSGGGTVFHDLGNVNYSVICPPASFDRNKHAEMVVRALHSLGVPNTRVNERHDIVLDVQHPEGRETGGSVSTFKISGSAYKLTRLRSLHHGTCLLASPNRDLISFFLRSPAAPYIKARGVESVRSPVCNIFPHSSDDGPISSVTEAFEEAVVSKFGHMYGSVSTELLCTSPSPETANTSSTEDVEAIPLVQSGLQELRSLDWIYNQTPQFTFSTHPTSDDPRPRPEPRLIGLTDGDTVLPADLNASLTVRHGQVTEVHGTGLPATLKETTLHHVDDWRKKVDEPVGIWLNGLFGTGR